MKIKNYYLVSLGCAKNTIDSESMASLLNREGYQGVDKPGRADLLIVNTCGFIQAAREESLQTLQELAQKKKPGQRLVAAGCMTERHRQFLLDNVEGIDGFLGTRRWMDIVDVAEKVRSAGGVPYTHFPEAQSIGRDEHGVLRAVVQGGSAYIKIADGCRRGCAFCAIPLIKGPLVSRPSETILSEARQLQEMGVRELVLIAQDTTDYGNDLGMKDGLANLLEKMLLAAPDIPWLRLMYAFPGMVSDRLIEVMAKNERILPYLDIPLQHASQKILRSMNRPSDLDWVYRTLEKMRTALPDLALRTTLIVGYPGEGEADFKELLNFVESVRFDHLGAFAYSYEEGTPAAPLGDPIAEDEKQARLERLMLAQEKIALGCGQRLIGRRLPVLVEGYAEGISVGRSYRDAPEIDGLVFIEGEAPVGELVQTQISGAMVHDLTANLIR